MLPRLQAQEQIARVEATGLGSGAYGDDSRQMMRRLREKAFGEGPQRGRPANPGQLAAIGIGVRRAPPKKAVRSG